LGFLWCQGDFATTISLSKHNQQTPPCATRNENSSLDLLPEMQRTGDIFFPHRSTEASLGGHRSPEAAAIVRDFLARKPDLPERLRWTVLSAADDLFRASRQIPPQPIQ
jgi:hypothetical protein